jgi:hypothetical protein
MNQGWIGSLTLNVRFGSKAVIPIGLTYDRFAP